MRSRQRRAGGFSTPDDLLVKSWYTGAYCPKLNMAGEEAGVWAGAWEREYRGRILFSAFIPQAPWRRQAPR
jgi:hypothetical protein